MSECGQCRRDGVYAICTQRGRDLCAACRSIEWYGEKSPFWGQREELGFVTTPPQEPHAIAPPA